MSDMPPQIVQFLDALFGGQSHGTLFLAGGPRQAGGKVTPWRDTPYDLARIPLERIARAALARSRREEVYISAALFAGTRRIEAHALCFPCLYSDVDDGDVALIGVPPTVLLRSSPDRFHAFWRLAEPTDRATATAINQRIAYACHGDRSGWDATQVLRLPGLPNWKYDGVVSALEAINDRRYQPADFAHLPPVATERPIATTVPEIAVDREWGTTVWAWAAPRLSPRMMRVANGDDADYECNPSRGDAALILALRSLGLTVPEVVAAFAMSPRGPALQQRKGAGRFSALVSRAVHNSYKKIGGIVSL